MNTSRAPSKIITPESATSAIGESLGDVRPLKDSIRRDPLYYNAPLIILVEAVLFKIPRSYFENVDTFRKTYLFGPDGEVISDGYTDQQPLRLDGISAADFRCLLKVTIREDLEEDMPWTVWTSVLKLSQMWEMKPIYDLALRKILTGIHKSDEWIAALKMSTQLKIQDLREIAIGKLTDQLNSPLQKIEFGTEYKISSCLLEGYTEFVMRNEVISAEDEEQLGWRRTSSLFRVRHRRLEKASKYKGVRSDILNVFAKELADIEAFDCSQISHLRPELLTATDPSIIQRDQEYYCIEIIFFVEGTLFKVPRYLFEESSDVFRGMFSLPTPEGVSPDGCSDKQPLFLEGIRKKDFRRLLKVMKFPVRFQESALKSRHVADSGGCEEPVIARTKKSLIFFEDSTVIEWASVLELSCRWQMAKIQKTAVEQILKLQNRCLVRAIVQQDLLRLANKLGIIEIRNTAIQRLTHALLPVESIQLGNELQADSLVLCGYKQLIQMSGGISEEHEGRLGRKTTSKLFRIRDAYLQGLEDGGFSFILIELAMDKIKEEFAEELEAVVWVGN